MNSKELSLSVTQAIILLKNQNKPGRELNIISTFFLNSEDNNAVETCDSQMFDWQKKQIFVKKSHAGQAQTNMGYVDI